MSQNQKSSVTRPGGRQKLEGKRLLDWVKQIEGDWRHVPSPEGLFILQQLDAPRLRGCNGRLALCGELSHQSELTDYLNLIQCGRWTGHLHVLDGETYKVLSFKTGDVYDARSNAPEDRLGELAVRTGLIQRDQLDTVLRLNDGQRRIGSRLVTNEYITTHDLYSLIQRQAEEIFFSLLIVGSGQFFFFREESTMPTTFLLSTQNLMMAGFQRIDEMSYFREKIPTSCVVFERCKVKSTPKPLDENELAVLELVDGSRDLLAVATESRLGEFETTKTAFQLLQSGLIAATASDNLGLKGQKAKQGGLYEVVALFNEVFARIFDEAKQAGCADELLTAASSFFEANNQFSELFRNVTSGPDGTLDASHLIANVKESLTESKVEFLYQGLNEFLFFQTFIAGETLDTETEETLHERLSEIIEGDDHHAPERPPGSTNTPPPLSIV